MYRSLRGTALAVLAAVGRLGSTTAQFYNAALVEVSIEILLLTSAAAMLVASALTMILPLETAGAALADTVGDAADVSSKASSGGSRGAGSAAAKP